MRRLISASCRVAFGAAIASAILASTCFALAGRISSRGAVSVRQRRGQRRSITLGIRRKDTVRLSNRLASAEFRIADARITDAKYLPHGRQHARKEHRTSAERLDPREKERREPLAAEQAARVQREEAKRGKKKIDILF